MQTISVTELKHLIDKGEQPVIIDVRELYEYEDYNINGRLISLGNLQASLPDLEEIMDQEIVIHCHSGARSAAATDFLTKQGFANVKNLTGGMLAWKAMIG